MKDTLPVTGGKGSIGNAVLHEFLDSSDVKAIKNLSRDEKKQDDTRRFYKNPKINIIWVIQYSKPKSIYIQS